MKTNEITLALSLLLLAGLCRGGTMDWTAGSGGQYGDAANWSSDPALPGDADNVYFRVGGAPSYQVGFSSPAVGPTNYAAFVADGNDVTFDIGSQTYSTIDDLTVAGVDGTRLAVNGGTLEVGDLATVAHGNYTFGELAISNGATVRSGYFYCGQGLGSTGIVRVTGSSTVLDMRALFFNAQGSGNGIFLVDDGATVRSDTTANSYVSSSSNNTSMVLVTGGAQWVETNKTLRLSPYAGRGGKLMITGTGSVARIKKVYMQNHGQLVVGKGALLVTSHQQSLSIVDDGVLSGGGKLSTDAVVNHYFNAYFSGNAIVEPGDGGTGTLTIQDAWHVGFQNGADLRIELAGTALGEFDRVVTTNSNLPSTQWQEVEFHTNNNVEVTVLEPYVATAEVGDSFDIVNCVKLEDGANNVLQETDGAFPSVSFVDPLFAGVLTIESVGVRKALRLTLTAVPPNVAGTVVMIR